MQIYHGEREMFINMGYDKNKTEFQIMNEIKSLRLYVCGNAVWECEN